MEELKVLKDEINGFIEKMKDYNETKLSLQTKSTELIFLKK